MDTDSAELPAEAYAIEIAAMDATIEKMLAEQSDEPIIVVEE